MSSPVDTQIENLNGYMSQVKLVITDKDGNTVDVTAGGMHQLRLEHGEEYTVRAVDTSIE